MEGQVLRDDGHNIWPSSKRHKDLVLQQLKNVKKQTLNDWNAIQQVKLQEFNDNKHFKRQMTSEFVSQPLKQERRTKSASHDNLKSKELKIDHFLTLPTIPAYSPMDTEPNVMLESRSRKYPVLKKFTTTEEMKKPHISSLGVLPIRSSSEIPNLRVILEGVPATLTIEEDEPKLYNTPATSFVISQPLEVVDSDGEYSAKEKGQSKERKRKDLEKEKRQEEAPSKKPAILSRVGTTVAVKLCERQKLTPKPSYLHGLRKQTKPARVVNIPDTSRHLQSSPLSDEISSIDGSDDKGDHVQVNDDVETAVLVLERSYSQISEDGSVLSTEELLEEAKRISSGRTDQEKKHQEKKHIKSSQPSVSKKKYIKKGKDKDHKASEAKPEKVAEVKRGERTVDEIIASLRNQSAHYMETEADRRIKLIMDRVMSRTNPNLTSDLEDMKVAETTAADEVDERTDGRESGFKTPPEAPELAVAPAVNLEHILQEDEMDSNNIPVSGVLNEPVQCHLGLLDQEDKENYTDWKAVTPQPTELSELTQAKETISTWMEDFVIEDEKAEISYDDGVDGIVQPLSIQQAWEDLLAPPEATLEDILNVRGEVKEIQGCRTSVSSAGTRINTATSSISFLSTWTQAGEKQNNIKPGRKFTNNVHHFCLMTMDYQLPQSLMHVGRKYHTPDRFSSVMPDQPYRFQPGELAPLMEGVASSTASTTRIEDAAARIVQEAKTVEGENADPTTLLEWQQKAYTVIGELDLSVYGGKIQIRTDETQVYWNPAPPKLGAAPHKVKEILFPQYYLDELDELGQVKGVGESDSSEEDDVVSQDDRTVLQRTILKRHNSAETLTTFRREQSQGEDGDTVLKSREHDLQPHEPGFSSDNQAVILQKLEDFVQRRPQTAPSTYGNGEILHVQQDFNIALNEIRKQRGLLNKAKEQKQVQEPSGALSETEVQQEVVNILATPGFDIPAVVHEHKTVKKVLTPAEEALQAGRKYVILPKIQKKKKRVRKIDTAKIQAAEKMLMTKPVKKLLRRESMPRLNRVIEREMRVPWKVRTYRSSIPDLLNFEEYKTRKRMPAGEDEREWVRAIWNKWFDLVFPPTPEESDEDDAELQDQRIAEKTEEIKINTETVSDIPSQDVIEIDPILDTPENRNLYQDILQEIDKMNDVKEGSCKFTAFDFCRRGALYRKIGQLKKAEMDLDRAIKMEPEFVDAYWNRHLLYILQDRKEAAVDDLKFILKKNKSHAGAYKSMAEIYKNQNDTTMAIINYSSAIKFKPLDHEAYFQRGQMYEQRGDMLLAMEDYAKAMKIMPSRTDIIMKHGMYYFENENWQNAIIDFTELLKVDPLSAAAHLIRGKAYVKMNNWIPALQDFSAAIHLDPHSWQAYYLRACILRKAHPRKAMQDYSVSLLLNDSEENFLSFLHRGILYNALEKPEDAIADFESTLKLNKDLAAAHVNLGLIYMTRQSNFHRAIQKFTFAISVDPTYIRAYVCRADAYHVIREMKKALKDFTRAIHMRPDVHHYYLHRGQLLLELGSLDLAAFCVHHASEIGMDNPAGTFGGLPTQQAVVQSFLKNYDKAVDILEQATRTKPIAPYFMLLGKTHMKAKQFKEAVISFRQALDKLKPWQKHESWPPETAEAHYLTGLCLMELRNYNEALQQFNMAIKFNPSCADAYYQRGLASVKLKNFKGILDFNKALALDPKMFQAYLSRACYYGMKGKYAKAILNCNEAIKLQPKSLRAYLYRGSIKYHIKAYELAILDLTKAISIDTQSHLPYFNRAVCYHETGQFDKALTDYSIVLLLGDVLGLQVLINRGLLYFERQDYMNALSDFQAAAKINPNDHTILHTLGLCFHKLNRVKEAVAVFTKCLQFKPFFLDGFIARGNAYMDCRNELGLKFARRDFQHVLHLNPGCLPARINLAYTAQVSGKLMQAWKHFTSIIEVRPGYKPALEGRAIVNLQMSNTFGAFQDISQSITYGPTAELLTNRGVISQFMGDRVMAMQDYQRAIKLDPSYSLAYFNAGNVYFHTRHFKQALDYYTKATKYDSKDDSAFLNCAITKALLHDTQGAFADFETAAKLSPYSSHIFFNKANLYASLQQYDMAEKEYTKALELKPDDPLMLKRRADVRGKLGRQSDAIEDYKRAVDIQMRPHKLISS